jgi:hypothetical protein
MGHDGDSMNNNRLIAAALGNQLWTTDSFIPRYRSGQAGPWKIDPGGQLVTEYGYYSGPCMMEMLPSLHRKSQSATGDEDWETWMSLTPHEIESQQIGVRGACGSVVVMGLGMGWIAANTALNPQVRRVAVVERDPRVIKLFQDTGAYDSIPTAAAQKIEIIEGDALLWRPGAREKVDFLYADIWLRLAEPGTLRQVRRMQANVQAGKIYYWGQEIAIYSAARRFVAGGSKITSDAVGRAVKEVIDLPLLVPDGIDYANMIDRVIRNRIQRKLTIDVNLV